jgi:hypothetical protein
LKKTFKSKLYYNKKWSYSPLKIVKNVQKWMNLIIKELIKRCENAKMNKNNLKGVKIPQNGSKGWAIVHAK